MKTKLTLRMDRDIIDRAKEYAEDNDTSLSKMVAAYFRILVDHDQPSAGDDEDWKEGLGPMTRSFVGIASGAELTEDDYRRHLEEKHV